MELQAKGGEGDGAGEDDLDGARSARSVDDGLDERYGRDLV